MTQMLLSVVEELAFSYTSCVQQYKIRRKQ